MEEQPQPKRSKFDWALLGVAVGVMLVLIALLVPALGAAREKARRATCLCNLKQIGLAMRLYSGDYKERFPTDPQATTLGSWALLTNAYLTSHRSWICPSDTGIAGCNALSGRMPPNPFTARILSYSYNGFGLTEKAQPDTPLACDRTSGDVGSVTPYINNQWTHKSDGGMVLFVDGHVTWQQQFVPPMYRGRNP